MRRTFGKVITELADRDEKIYVLVGDIGYQVFDEFREKHPDRFINIGICEQSMIGVSAGMALEGLKPWVYTITPFLIERPFEQIKLDIDQQNVNNLVRSSRLLLFSFSTLYASSICSMNHSHHWSVQRRQESLSNPHSENSALVH